MKLSDEQILQIKQWANEGASLSEIQTKLETVFGIKLTYMDTRLLMLEIGVDIKDKKKAVSSLETKAASEELDNIETDKTEDKEDDSLLSDEEDVSDLAEKMEGMPNVSVTVDRVTMPGAVISGTVTFSDGNNANWHIDQYGRVAISGTKPGIKPSKGDIMAFQQKLREILEKRGF